MKQIAGNDIQVLHFTFENVQVCINIKYIKKVLSIVALNEVPDGPDFLAGVMDYFEKCIPAIDLCIYLGFTRSIKHYSLETPIIICGHHQAEVALIVDNITNVTVINENNMQLREKFDEKTSPFVAVVKNDCGISLLLNTDFLFKDNFLNKKSQPLFDKEFINNITANL